MKAVDFVHRIVATVTTIIASVWLWWRLTTAGTESHYSGRALLVLVFVAEHKTNRTPLRRMHCRLEYKAS